MCRHWCVCLLLFGSLAVRSSGYFIIDEPAAQRQWTNNAPNLVSWSKGLLDGIDGFDVEMARMSIDALVLVARNVPVKPAQFNILIQDFPAGDDYFLIFLNSTHGVMYATSRRFAILPPNAPPPLLPPSSPSPSSSPSTPPPPAPNVPTVTLSGAPNPTRQFATTFPALANSAGAARRSPPFELHHHCLTVVVSVSVAAIFFSTNVLFFLFGALWTLVA